jgi:hypothetical protein
LFFVETVLPRCSLQPQSGKNLKMALRTTLDPEVDWAVFLFGSRFFIHDLPIFEATIHTIDGRGKIESEGTRVIAFLTLESHVDFH